MTSNDGGPVQDRATTTTTAEAVDAGHRTGLTSSQQVSFWSVHEHVAPMLSQVRSWPTVGTPAWCVLDDGDPVKLAALVDAAQHWALRIETCQQARCDASREVACAVDWSAVATGSFVHECFYAARPWLKRVAS